MNKALFSNAVARYMAAFLLAVAACTLSVVLERFSQLHNPILFFAAVGVAGWYLGPGPGWLTAFLSVATFAYYFASPVYSLRIDAHARAFFDPFVLCLALILGASHFRHYIRK